jgi:hypothetical protein
MEETKQFSLQLVFSNDVPCQEQGALRILS